MRLTRVLTAACIVGSLFVGEALLFADEAKAKRLRAALSISQDEKTRLEIAREVRLPVTRGFSQLTSQLCWAFAAISMLESNYLHAHPGVEPSEVMISRWHVGKLAGSTQRRGVSYDAIYDFIADGGLVMHGDYPVYGPSLPTRTTFRGTEMTPSALAEEILGDQSFWSYAFSDRYRGWRSHPDPDANRGTESFYLPRALMGSVIVASLQAGKTLTYTSGGHIIQIYGVTLNADGEPLTYYMQDSYSPYFYEAAATSAHRSGFEVTTVADLVSTEPDNADRFMH